MPVPTIVFATPTRINFQKVTSKNFLNSVFMQYISTGVLDNIAGPTFDFFVNFCNIITNDPQADHYDATGKQLD